MMTDDDADRDEEVLRRLLREEADTVHPQPNWDDVRDRAQGRRRRRWIPAAAAVIALLVVTAGLAALVSDDDHTGVVADGPTKPDPNADPPRTTAPALTTTVPPSTPTTAFLPRTEAGAEVEPLALPAGAPLGDDEVVASIVTPSGGDPDPVEVVVLSKTTGDIVRTLADGFDISEGGVSGITISPDRRTALYVVSTAACASRIEAVAVDGSSEPERVTDDGSRMALSPDGSMLAVAPGDVCNSPPSLTLVPTEGGPTTRYIGVAPEDDGIESMAFTDDGTLLFASGPRTTEPTFRLRRLDLASGTAIELTPGPELTSYSSLDRHGSSVTALENPFGGKPSLVTLQDGQIADRRTVQITGDLSGGRVGYDDSGAVIMARSGDDRLSIDGRVIREDVLDVAF